MLFLISSGLTFFVINFGHNGTWELKKERDGIKVFTRSIAGSKYVEFKAEAIFKVPMQNFVDVLKMLKNMKSGCPI
jgi:hypothetical protein